MSNNTEGQWISVSEMALRRHVTTQTIYNRIKKGVYKTQEFKRGSMNGVLVFDEIANVKQE